MTEQVFEGARVRVARELARRTQASLAREIQVSAAAVSQFEGGATRPSPTTLAALADTLGVPEAFFTLPLADTHEGFFRSLRRTAVAARRRARAVAHVAHDVALLTERGVPHSVPAVPLALDADRTDIEAAAARVRTEWRLPPGPIHNVVELLEQHGVVVIRLPLSTAAVDAFSLPFSDHPVGVLGADKGDRARSRFDGSHELGHLVIHGDQVWGLKEVEEQAHAFAAAFLMPADDIIDQLPSSADWAVLFGLKQYWQVSLAALLRRARDLGVMSPQTYVSAVKAASARGWRRTEPVPLGPPERPHLVPDLLASAAGTRSRQFLPGAVLDEILESID